MLALREAAEARAVRVQAEAARAAQEARLLEEQAQAILAAATRRRQEALQLEEELEATREVARRDQEERVQVAQGGRREAQAGDLVPFHRPAAEGGQREPPEVVRQREVHGWVMDPRRRQDVEHPRSVHDWVPDPRRRQDAEHRRSVHDPDSPRAVKTIVRESVGATQWPMLTKDNYIEWSSVMKVKLQVRHMWDAVDTGDVDDYEDQRALILSAKGSAKAAWDAIAASRVGSDRSRFARSGTAWLSSWARPSTTSPPASLA